MKKVLLTLFSLGMCVSVFAQKIAPEIKTGTSIKASAYVQGQEFPLLLTVKSLKDPVVLAWTVNGYGDGTFEMSDQGLESATQMMATEQPSLGVTKLSDNETFGVISKAAYKSLVDTKTLTYNGIKFKIKTANSKPFMLSGKEVDATNIVSEDGKLEFWILNNATFPLVLQSDGLPIDIAVSEIK
jgi:hypothetical protein